MELLEGIQTLFTGKHQEPFPVVYLVAADRRWLCESYAVVYQEFVSLAHEPGRPLGLAFVEKVFDFSVHIPTISPTLAADPLEFLDDPTSAPGADDIQAQRDERGVRIRLVALEGARVGDVEPPNIPLRRAAVRHLLNIEKEDQARCGTEAALAEIFAWIEPSPSFRHPFQAYRIPEFRRSGAHDWPEKGV
ncbi:MAG: hypothetical protein ACLP50_15470 [Solirubrobacteraceae bacterium]